MACRTCPQSGWPPASTRVRPPDTPWTPSPPISSSCGHPAVAGRAPDMADLSTVRTPQFKVTAQPMGLDPVRTATAKRRTPPAPSVRPAARPSGHGKPRGLHVLALTGQHGNAHAPSASPRRYQQPDPPVMTTCTHARCRNVRKPGPRPISARSCPASTMDATIGRLPDTACPVAFGRTPSTPPARHPNRKRRGQGTHEWHGRHSDIPDRHDHEDSLPGRRTPPLGPALRLGNQGRLGDGNTASATVTTSGTRQLLGIAPPFKPRLGALFSSDDFGSSVERDGGGHPLWRCGNGGWW
jgi:hypothetical protein